MEEEKLPVGNHDNHGQQQDGDLTPYERLRARYEEGRTPWDQEDPPPEVIDFAAANPAGRALDIGCGFGRAALHLARRGWQVDAFDFVEIPIAEARRRAAAAGLEDQTNFFVAKLEDLDQLSGPYDLILDVGCAHHLSPEQWREHHANLHRLLRPGGLFLLYGRLLDPEPAGDGDLDGEEENGRWGIDEPPFLATMASGFTAEKIERGMTHMADGWSYTSAWYWFRRLPAA